MNEKFQPGDMVKATQGAGKFFKSGDVGRVIRHATDGTVKVDWSAGNNPQGHHGDGEWWANESELVRLAEPSTAKLTLPIVVGKKYVRRDGVVVEAQMVQIDGGLPFTTLVVGDPGSSRSPSNTVNKHYGKVFSHSDSPFDFVSDYIEPAKGHPHAASMAEFAKDAAESETPWDYWQMRDGENWAQMLSPPSWAICCEYRRKPKANPDPHAATAAEYAKDMAETDKAWERWERMRANSVGYWEPLASHPLWDHSVAYRRKEQS